MNKLLITLACSMTLLCTATLQAGTIVENTMGYSATLPENWVKEDISPTSQIFTDSTGTYPSMIGIIKYDFSSDTFFASSDEWVRANFIAYVITMESDPFCAVAFQDTVNAKHNNVLWAADAYTYVFSGDTSMPDYAEYIRFTATGSIGYEIYVMGSIADMDTNIGFYAAIIENIQIDTGDEKVAIQNVTSPRVQKTAQPVANLVYHDLLGRKSVAVRSAMMPGASRMILVNGTKRSLLRTR